MGEWKNGLRDGYGEIYEPDNNYIFGYFKNNKQNGFFIFYNLKNSKIIVGYNINGKIEGIVKYFRNKKEGKLIIVKNGKKIFEIENEDKIINYLDNNINKYNDKQIDYTFNKYFYMKREQIEKILINKCNNIDINEIIIQLKKIKK